MWLPLDLESVLSGSKEAYQRRDENDFLYRTRHLSEWASASVDYDEYFAPTHTVEDGGIRNDGSHFPNLLATDVNMADRDLGGLFFPIHRFLANVSAQVEELVFKKWPALIPDQSDVLCVDSTTLSPACVVWLPTCLVLRAPCQHAHSTRVLRHVQ